MFHCLGCESGFKYRRQRRDSQHCNAGFHFHTLLHSFFLCCTSSMPRVKDKYSHLMAKENRVVALESYFAQINIEGGCSSRRLDGLTTEDLSFNMENRNCEVDQGEDDACCSASSSPFSWSKGRGEDSQSATSSMASSAVITWEENQERWSTSVSEVEMIKERFAKLLLGEDMSGSGNGVCSALALSNAITNLAASVFGEIWRLEPLPDNRKKMWQREMDWLLAATNHIREFVPSSQTLQDGSSHEVMVSRPRSDLYINLPALRKLDTMLLESLDGFRDTEFWYVDQCLENMPSSSLCRQEEKWWLPSPKVPAHGLSNSARKHLLQQRDFVSQIWKASLAINTQILLEMEVPQPYFEALPKNARAMVGEAIYRCLSSEYFSPESLLRSLDLSNEHRALDAVNRIEAAIHVWGGGRKQEMRPNSNTSSRGVVKDFVGDVSKRDTLLARADNLLSYLKQRFPGLPQTLLEVTKIQYNRDVGRSILESYARVMESLASKIVARINDVIYADDMLKQSLVPSLSLSFTPSFSLSLCTNTPLGTPTTSPTQTPFDSPPRMHTESSYPLLKQQ